MAKKSLLLVDDETDILDILKIPLVDMGYTVYTAENGEKALHIFREKRPPIVVTDIKMPGMDGIELLERIKREDPETEVIMITGHGDMNLAIQSLRDDATDFITKPINVTTLQTALNRADEKIAIKEKLKEYTEALETHLLEKIRLLEKAESEMKKAYAEKDALGGARFDSLFDNLPCYIYVVDRDWRLVSVNKMFRETFGENPGEYCYQILRQQDRPCQGCIVEQTLLDGKSYQSQMTLMDLSDNPINVLAWTVPIRNGSGDINQVMVMSTDTSQIDELKDSLSSLGLMVGSVSHGIKGLITGLEGGVYVLDSGFAKDDKERIREGYELVKETVDRIKKLVLDLLFYAKDKELKKEPIEILNFADDVAKVVAPKAESEGIKFVKDFDTSLGTFEVDPGMLSTALINILENAVDACIEDTAKESHEIRFSVRAEKEHVVFSIQDNGIGMDKKTKENMFSLFFSAKGKKGTGLGLFIAKKIIQEHGGIITVESTRGKGSRFEVKIPLPN
ncbi:MAG: response regulator [Deltaproteobacteria bacterium]|nr:response regulator [Deltaproteobacteria bacterium]MBW2152917.1 response regulator [Deltaproteobacteria bacterium]